MLTTLVLIPILAALLIGFCRFPARPLALAAAMINLLLGCACLYGYDLCTCVDAMNPFNLTLNFGIQQIMVLLTVLVTFATVVGTRAPKEGKNLYYISTLLISAGALGAFLSNSIIGFFSFHELALIPTFLMIGMYGSGHKRSIAWRATLYLGLGSLVLLVGLVALISTTGCTTFTAMATYFQTTAVYTGSPIIPFMLLIGFGTLVSLFPFHSWAAPAYASAPTPVAMMHAGVLKKFGLYGLFMFASILPPNFFVPVTEMLLFCLVGNVLWVGWVTINQKRLDYTLGNSSVMHMGYIFLAFAAFFINGGSTLAMKAVILLMFAHGITIALLFLLCGSIERSTGTLQYSCLGGLATKKPKLAFLFGIAAMASIGLPGLANFPGEIMTFFAGFENWYKAGLAAYAFGPLQIATICCLWGLVIGAVYMLRAYKSIFQGPLSPDTEQARTVGLQDRLAALILVVTLIVVGFCPNIVLNILQ